MSNVKIFVIVIVILILGVVATIIISPAKGGVSLGPSIYDGFAQCLKDKGAVFYGAFWCPHCKAQKALFGSSAKLLPYVECSTPDASNQTQECKDKKIEGYPTWELADGTRVPTDSTDGSGVKLETLATKTGCVLPQ
jgi:thiol-disulfide isomerase/thioredoxin